MLACIEPVPRERRTSLLIETFNRSTHVLLSFNSRRSLWYFLSPRVHFIRMLSYRRLGFLLRQLRSIGEAVEEDADDA